MILGGIKFSLALLLSFFLFYFSTPYWTGKGMAEVSKSGIWRATYRLLSRLGTALYRLCERIFSLIPLQRRGARGAGAIPALINLLLFIGALFLLTQGYNFVTESIFDPAVTELAKSDGEGIWGFLSKSLIFVKSVRPVFDDRGLLAAIVATLLNLLLYTVINTVFFSILFGFLQNKVKPLDISTRIVEGDKSTLPGQIANAIKAFVGKFTVVLNIKTAGVLPLFVIVVFVFGFVVNGLDKASLTLGEVFAKILEEIKIIPIIGSYVTTLVVCKGAVKGAEVAVAHMPPAIQRSIHNLSDKGNQWVEKEDTKRQQWASEHSTTPPPPPDAPRRERYSPEPPPPPDTPHRERSYSEPPPRRKAPLDDPETARQYIQLKLEKYHDSLQAEGKFQGLDTRSPALAVQFAMREMNCSSEEEALLRLAPALNISVLFLLPEVIALNLSYEDLVRGFDEIDRQFGLGS